MASFTKFPVITEGLINALQEHLPDRLPGYNEKEPVSPHNIAFAQGQQAVITLLRTVHKSQEKKKG